MEEQLKKIEKLAEKKNELIDIQNYNKYYPIFKDTIDFLKTQKVLLYGGLAINELMPYHLKIYKKHALPDIDVFCTNPKKVGSNLIAYLIKKGYPLTSISEALHENTYKIFANGLQIADITLVSKYAFKKLYQHSIQPKDSIRVVDPEFLRLSLHVMMSQSNDANRWSKVFQRIISFYEVFKPRMCNFKKNIKTKSNSDKIPEDLINKIYGVLKNSQYVLFGLKELKLMFETDNVPFSDKMPIIQMFTDKTNFADVATIIQNKIKDYKLDLSVIYEGDDFAPPHAFLYYKKTPVIGMYYLDACITYNNYDKYRIASIHTMLRFFLSVRMSSYIHLQKLADDYSCIGNMLSVLQIRINKEKKPKAVHQQFILDCYGVQYGLITLRRKMMARRNNLSLSSSDHI